MVTHGAKHRWSGGQHQVSTGATREKEVVALDNLINSVFGEVAHAVGYGWDLSVLGPPCQFS